MPSVFIASDLLFAFSRVAFMTLRSNSFMMQGRRGVLSLVKVSWEMKCSSG